MDRYDVVIVAERCSRDLVDVDFVLAAELRTDRANTQYRAAAMQRPWGSVQAVSLGDPLIQECWLVDHDLSIDLVSSTLHDP